MGRPALWAHLLIENHLLGISGCAADPAATPAATPALDKQECNASYWDLELLLLEKLMEATNRLNAPKFKIDILALHGNYVLFHQILASTIGRS